VTDTSSLRESSTSERSRRGPLWASVGNEDAQTLPLWIALIAAAALEFLLPLLIYGVDWSFLPWFEPPPVPVMTVDLKEPPPPEPPPPPPEKPKQKPKPKQPERLKQVPVEIPKPVPGEVPSKITLAKPEPELKPEPKKPEPPPPEPEPEVEAPPLPSVFQDVKPVRKAKIKYPPEAEAAHIEGHVRVRLAVDVEGNVTDVEILLAEPAGVFDQAVLEGVRQYKFKRDGTAYRADQEVIFKIDP
jgi:periplasmic protein TonB